MEWSRHLPDRHTVLASLWWLGVLLDWCTRFALPPDREEHPMTDDNTIDPETDNTDETTTDEVETTDDEQ
ncbi:hypothetical protein GCM10027563_39150 [Parasphingorhabdus pacifica]